MIPATTFASRVSSIGRLLQVFPTGLKAPAIDLFHFDGVHVDATHAPDVCVMPFDLPHHVPAIAPAPVGRELVRRKNIVKLSVSPSLGVRKSHQKLLRLAEMRVCKVQTVPTG